jgi:hypothetical protein
MLTITRSVQYSTNPNSVFIGDSESVGNGVWFYNISQCSVILRPKYKLVDGVKTVTNNYVLSINGVTYEANIDQTIVNGDSQVGVTYEDFSKELESVFTNAS